MALNLRRSIVLNIAANAGLCFALNIALGAFSGALKFSIPNLAWPLALALGIGLFTAWRMIFKMKNRVLLDLLRVHTGKSLGSGFTMARYILFQRVRFAQARRRLMGMSSYRIAKRIDAFEKKPKRKWSPPSARLAALREASLADLDKSAFAQGPPPIMEMENNPMLFPTVAAPAQAIDDKDAAYIPPAASRDNAGDTVMQQRVESAANWFYWIAGLSLVNTLVNMLGSDWGFAIGLGISQILIGIANEPFGSAGVSSIFNDVLWAGSFAAAGFFAVCGWLAGRPSVLAFAAGIAVFALDSLIFLIGGDWIGLVFHVLALFFLSSGFLAARGVRKQVVVFG